jgi:hypothetical protein
MKLTSSGKALVVTMLFQLLFGGYLAAKDFYAYEDATSTLTVLIIYLLLGVFTAMFLFGKRLGLVGILWQSTILIIFHSVFIFISAGPLDAGVHDPLANWWATLLRYPFFLLTLIFYIKVSRESRQNLRTQE